MFRSSGLRFILVGVLAVLMFAPLTMVSGVVEDRGRYSRQTISDVSREWGGPQLVSGPVIVIPVTEEVTYQRKREAVDALTGLSLRDANGLVVFEHFEETVTEVRSPVFVYANTLDIDVSMVGETRKRGIFEVPVYRADTELRFDFSSEMAEDALTGFEELHWEDARLQVHLSDNRSLRGEAVLEADGVPLLLEPIAAGEGLSGLEVLGDPRDRKEYRLKLGLNGAQSFSAASTGRTTRLTLSSDWPHPSFYGTFLPDSSNISDDGFTASWTIPHLARPLPIVSRDNQEPLARKNATMGARFITPNDFYQKAYRSARYGILFIALTFLTILLLDRTSERPTHPVQYLLVGLAQCVWVLLMVSYAEQIGFGAAYAGASGATIVLLTLFGATALKLGRRTLVLGALLVILYAVLFMILRSADFALLAGSTLAFLALAGTMHVTRNEDWQGSERIGGWLRRSKEPKAQAT